MAAFGPSIRDNPVLSLLANAGANPIQWAELGLTPGIDLGFFTLRWYSLAYLAGILLGYWHLSKMVKSPGAPMAQRLSLIHI